MGKGSGRRPQNISDEELEKYLYMPIGHNSDSSFDFEPTDRQSCGFVGVQKPKFTED